MKQSAKISFDDDVAPTRSRMKALTSVEKNNALNLEERLDVQDSNIKIEGTLDTPLHLNKLFHRFGYVRQSQRSAMYSGYVIVHE